MFVKNAKVVKIFLLILGCFPLYGRPLIPETSFQEKFDLEPQEDALAALDRMIDLTEKQQTAQKKLKKIIVAVRKNKELFIKGDQSKLHAYYMIQSAKEGLTLIKAYHLQHLFSSDFLEELTVFAQLANKEKPSL